MDQQQNHDKPRVSPVVMTRPQISARGLLRLRGIQQEQLRLGAMYAQFRSQGDEANAMACLEEHRRLAQEAGEVAESESSPAQTP